MRVATCQEGCASCAFFAFDREETAGRVYSVRAHRLNRMLELAHLYGDRGLWAVPRVGARPGGRDLVDTAK